MIGKDVSLSQSPRMHGFIAEKLGYKVDYKKISIPETEFKDKIEGLLCSLDGFNVTIPYKLWVLPYVKSVGDAELFGAVNTVNCKSRKGFNTDGEGFILMLENEGIEIDKKTFLVLGCGGAGRSISAKLKSLGAEVFVYDTDPKRCGELQREFELGVAELSKNKNYYAVINATGVGMHKSVGVSPVGEEVLKGCKVAVDLIYEPKESEFLSIAKRLNLKTLNGEGMLFYQAYFAECIYANMQPKALQAKELFAEYKKIQEI